MNVNDIFNSEPSQLSDELRDIDNKIKDAATRGLAGTVNKLAQRKRVLPSLIQEAKLRDINLQLKDAHSKMKVYEMESDLAQREFYKQSSEFPERAKELDLAKQQLMDNVSQAQLDRDNLRFAYDLAQQEYEELKQKRASLLLSQSNQ